jgi:transcriptional regulator with PAS, ATPase and Fis domain
VNTLPEEERRAGPPVSFAPFLFVALDCDRPLAPPARHSLARVDAVTIGRGDEAGPQRGRRQLELRLADPRVSTAHARLTRDGADWTIADVGSRNGTIVNGQRVAEAPLGDGDVVQVGRTLLYFRAKLATYSGEPADVDAAALTPPVPELATLIPQLARAFHRLGEVARSPISVVLQGESGTGKEVTAQAIHRLSGCTGAFVAINCGALPATLVESELFGYRKGAFSGADEDRPGLIRSADRGTLFLDEIGDLRPTSQAALLRVLQEREVTPLGATRPIKVNLRLVAATHRDLGALVKKGEFRSDLLARISGMTLKLPPLRERREDLGLLVRALLPRLAPERAGDIALGDAAARALFEHGWPLNVRELEKCLGAAVVLAGDGAIEPEHLALAPVDDTAPPPADPGEGRQEELLRLLREHRGNVSEVARLMGRSRMQVHRWIKQWDIKVHDFRR